MTEVKQTTETSTIRRPWDLWIMIAFTVLLALGAIGSNPTGLDNIFWAVVFLGVAYLLYTTTPMGRIAGIVIPLLNAVYEVIRMFAIEDMGSSLAIMMVVVAIIYIAYLQYRKDLFTN